MLLPCHPIFDRLTQHPFHRYFRKFEAYQPHPDYPLVDASARGRNGPVHTGFFNHITPPSKAFVNACVNIGIRQTQDFNGKGGTLGAARISQYSRWHMSILADLG
jgi:choline dehydrogenase